MVWSTVSLTVGVIALQEGPESDALADPTIAYFETKYGDIDHIKQLIPKWRQPRKNDRQFTRLAHADLQSKDDSLRTQEPRQWSAELRDALGKLDKHVGDEFSANQIAKAVDTACKIRSRVSNALDEEVYEALPQDIRNAASLLRPQDLDTAIQVESKNGSFLYATLSGRIFEQVATEPIEPDKDLNKQETGDVVSSSAERGIAAPSSGEAVTRVETARKRKRSLLESDEPTKNRREDVPEAGTRERPSSPPAKRARRTPALGPEPEIRREEGVTKVRVDSMYSIPHRKPGDPAGTFRVPDIDSDGEMEIEYDYPNVFSVAEHYEWRLKAGLEEQADPTTAESAVRAHLIRLSAEDALERQSAKQAALLAENAERKLKEESHAPQQPPIAHQLPVDMARKHAKCTHDAIRGSHIKDNDATTRKTGPPLECTAMLSYHQLAPQRVRQLLEDWSLEQLKMAHHIAPDEERNPHPRYPPVKFRVDIKRYLSLRNCDMPKRVRQLRDEAIKAEWMPALGVFGTPNETGSVNPAMEHSEAMKAYTDLKQ